MNSKLILTALVALLSLSFAYAWERPAHCLLPPPQGEGLCAMIIMGQHYNPDLDSCVEWNANGCKTVGGHSYATFEDCQADCMPPV